MQEPNRHEPEDDGLQAGDGDGGEERLGELGRGARLDPVRADRAEREPAREPEPEHPAGRRRGGSTFLVA